MVAPMEEDFSVYLSDKLQKINPDVDLDVFVPYLTGILETEDIDQEEREESIQGFLAEISEDNLEVHCAAIISEWNKFRGNRDDHKLKSEKSKAIEEKIASIREQQNQTIDKTIVISAEQKERKEAILKQYAQVAEGEGSDPEDDETEGAEASGDAAEDSLARNMNSLLVLQREKEKRDKAKEAADLKRQKDREDREKQKEKAKERKEAEKKRTQKGERRR